MKRADGRVYDEMRAIRIVPGYQEFAEGSALIELGKTRVLCSVSVEDRVPNFLKGSRTGWITAEYAMLPRSAGERVAREAVRVGRRFVIASAPSKADDNPEHIRLFDASSLSALFVEAGARRVSVEYVPGHMICMASL